MSVRFATYHLAVCTSSEGRLPAQLAVGREKGNVRDGLNTVI